MNHNLHGMHSISSVVHVTPHMFGHHPTNYNPMVKRNVLWIPLNVLFSKQRQREQPPRIYWLHFSFRTKQHQILQWKMECLQQKPWRDKKSEPHETPYAHKNKNKGKTHPKLKQSYSRSADQCLQNRLIGLVGRVFVNGPFQSQVTSY